MRRSRKDILICLISGFGYGLAWPPIGVWPLALIMPGLFLSRLIGRNREQAFLQSGAFFAGAWGVAFFWVARHPVSMAAVTSVVALICFASLVSGMIAYLSTLTPFRNDAITVVLAACGWFLFDVLMVRGPVPMPWLNAGLATAGSSWAIFWVKLGGPLALSFLVLSTGALFAFLISKRKPLLGAILIASVGLMPLLDTTHPISDDMAGLRVGLVQPGWTAAEWAEVSDTTKAARLLDFALERPRQDKVPPQDDVILFPETALPIGSPDELQAEASAWGDSLQAAVLSGAILETESGDFYNVIASSAAQSEMYQKRRMVPFAERVPFSSWIPFFERFAVDTGGVSRYSEGEDQTLLQVENVLVGPMICFESLFFRDGRVYRDAGAAYLFVFTQDGWWNSAWPRQQHFYYSQLLAAAVGLPVAHVSVDGRSGLFDSTGRVIVSTDSGSAARTSATLPLESRKTLFSRFGDWLVLSIFCFILGGALYVGRFKKAGSHVESSRSQSQ